MGKYDLWIPLAITLPAPVQFSVGNLLNSVDMNVGSDNHVIISDRCKHLWLLDEGQTELEGKRIV
jgi:hypothetical protein